MPRTFGVHIFLDIRSALHSFDPLPFPRFLIPRRLHFFLSSLLYLNYLNIVRFSFPVPVVGPSLDANNSRQNDITSCDFLQGKQVELPVSRSLCHRKHKFLAQALRSRKILSPTFGEVYVVSYHRERDRRKRSIFKKIDGHL